MHCNERSIPGRAEFSSCDPSAGAMHVAFGPLSRTVQPYGVQSRAAAPRVQCRFRSLKVLAQQQDGGQEVGGQQVQGGQEEGGQEEGGQEEQSQSQGEQEGGPFRYGQEV